MANPQYSVEADRYMSSGHANWPARMAAAVTPSDSAALLGGNGGNSYAKALYIGAAGDVTVIMAGDNSNSGAGTPVLFKAVPLGTWLWIQVRAVMATGTVSTSITALFD